MSLLFRIVYAAHANGTHHKLALDGLARVMRADTDAWQRLFLKHVARFLEGAKAPDNTFKDFKNHVLHVGDGYWGGALQTSQSWYQKLVAALKAESWEDAVYCAGVLSHYVTDPVHPFHTAQSEAENSIHRAVEWSINRSYDALRREAQRQGYDDLVAAPDGAEWLAELICRGAEKANRHYGALIAHYDFNTGVVDPPAGLDARAREIAGELILYASQSFARVLERAIAEAGVAPPEVSLTAETFLAALAMPRKWLEKRLTDAEDRRIVEAMYDELMATGRVDEALPEDDRFVRDLHEAEVARPREERLRRARAERVAEVLPAATAPLPDLKARPVAAPAPSTRFAAALGVTTERTEAIAPERSRALDAPSGESHSPPSAAEPAVLANPERPARTRKPITTADAVEAAPAIGTRLAERLQGAGVRTVGDLLAAPPADVAAALGVRHITSETVMQWQAATRLVMAVPGIDGTQAQLLAGAGFDSVEEIAAADPIDLSAALLRYAVTPAGQRLLRDGKAPDLERITRWIEAASAARTAA